MRRRLVTALFFFVAAPLLPAASVGSGEPLPIQASFQNAFARGAFSSLVSLPPPGDVQRSGSSGLLQEFLAKANSSIKFALIDPDPNGSNITWQVYGDIYTFYNSAAILNTAGYPSGDTTTCPSNAIGTCDYQFFSNNYTIFAYSTPQAVTFSVGDPFFTEWNRNGSLGIATGATTAITSAANTAGTQQPFLNGVVFSYPASAKAPSTFAVSGAIYIAFTGAGGYTTLGFPLGEEVVLSSGLHRQVFENGRIEWTPGTPPSVLFPIGFIEVATESGGLTLHAGSTINLVATVYDIHNALTTGRTLTWSTSNGNVAAVQGNGTTAVVQGIGPGAANIYVTGEGQTSAPLTVEVTASCCAIGEGAPTPAISQAFQIAATRNHLDAAPVETTRATTSVTQLGSGYVQTVSVAGMNGTSTMYVISESTRSGIAYVISGSLYAAYLANGGFTGTLGYPASDVSAGGTQTFLSGAALAGSPVQVVPVPIAGKWLQAGAETGPLGIPTGAASAFLSLSGISGNSQTFTNGMIYGIGSGSHGGQAFVLNGLILSRYLALSGTRGTLGIPTSDPYSNGPVQVQNFETGYIDLQPGAAAAVEHFNPRTPAVSAMPGSVGPGGRVHIDISGFAFGAALSISITGQPGFSVTVAGGSFTWDIVIPANTKAGTVTIAVKAAGSTDTASGAYNVTSLALLQPTLHAVSGDGQTGLPGSAAASPLIAVLQDLNGNPLPGVPVSYAVSPGAIAQVPGLTDGQGQIAVVFRLPASAGVAALSLSAAGRAVTFSALAVANSIPNFPSFVQFDANGGLTAALAAEIRYYQNLGTLASPNGLAAPAGLTQFLTASGGYSASDTGGQVSDPWIAMLFAGLRGGISVEAATLDHVRDLLNAGSPALLALSVQRDGTPFGGAAVNAIGVNADGSVIISDPNSAWQRTSLNDYLTGFAAQGHTFQATLSAVIRIVPTLTASNGFVIASPLSAASSASAVGGPCPSVDLLDSVDVSGVRFIECDGTQSIYQLSLGLQKGASIVDLGGEPAPPSIPANSGDAFGIMRTNGALSIGASTLTITAVVNAASMGPGLSPGGLFTIFGSGFTAGGATPVVTVSGQTTSVLAAFPFQINAQMPAGVSPGDALMQVSGAVGAASQPVSIAATAPGIFLLGGTQGAIVNQDGTINSASNPALRGTYISIYCTGLGSTTANNSLEITTTPVAVLIGEASVLPSFSGLTPGIAGLYQVNLQIPSSLTPGSQLPLAFEEAGSGSNIVTLAVQ